MTIEIQQEGTTSKYQRRRRVYEKLKTKREPLSTVPEDAVLQAIEQRRWKAMQVLFSLVLVFIAMISIRETFSGIHRFIQGLGSSAVDDEDRNSSRASSHLLRRKDENEDLPSEDADDLHAGPLPADLRFLVDVNAPFQKFDRALFWQIPRSGSATVKNILTQCFGLLAATETGAASAGDMLVIISDLEGGQYVNVDTASVAGIDHAAALQVGNLPNLQLIATPYLHEAAGKLFSEYYRGRMFTIIRHPIDRAVSLYYHMTSNKKSSALPPDMSLEDYARSPLLESNWMTRFLSNNMGDEVSLAHVSLAKEVLKKKCLVGLLKQKSESMRRFERYFNWNIDSERADDCHTKMLDWKWPNKNKHPQVREGSEAWRLIMKQNEFDMKLFHYAEGIFRDQAALFDN